MAKKTVKARRKQANYMDIGTEDTPKIEFMGAGFKELDEEPQAKETSKRYINDASQTSSISGYEWQTPFNADQIVSEPVIKFILEIGKLQKTGEDCERDYFMVDLDEPVTGKPNVFKARKQRVAIQVEKFGADDGEMTAEGNLLGQGDVIPGTFDVSQKKFTPDTAVIGG